MKKLILMLVLLIPVLASSQYWQDDNFFQKDAAVHFTISTTATWELCTLCSPEITHWEWSDEVALGLIFSAGMVKEFAIDTKPSYNEIAVNAVGCVAGFYMSRALNKWLNNSANLNHKQMRARRLAHKSEPYPKYALNLSKP